MKFSFFIAVLATFLFSCKTEGVKSNNSEEVSSFTKKDKIKLEVEKEKNSLQAKKVIGNVKLPEGIKIKYFVKGSGDLIKKGDVIQINYEVLLDDGTFVDGNKLLKRDWLPFLVGFGMQTSGWDLALVNLHIGDFVEIYLPSKYARGKIAIKGLIPPNSNNKIRIKILGKIKPSRVIDGTKVWVLEENKKDTLKAEWENEIDFHYMVGTPSNPKYDISYKRKVPYNFRFTDRGIVNGLKKALINAKRSDKLWVIIPASEGYGSKGLMDLVKPNEEVFYDIFIMDVR
jgi:FKBP-type peptidyl-prolyl cis-trans isomerase